MILIAEIIGWIATIFRSAGMLAKSASSVKWLVSAGNLFWMANGIITSNAPLIASNAICLVIMAIDFIKDKKIEKTMDKLIPWSERIKGARDMLVMLNRRMYLNTAQTPKLSKAEKIMCSAVIQLMLDDKTNIDLFLNEDEIVFYDWGKDKKGTPIKCKARFK